MKPTSFKLDPNLRDFATDLQWKYLQSWDKHGSKQKAAQELGVDPRALYAARERVYTNAAKRGYAPDYGLTHAVAPTQKLRGVSTLHGPDGEIKAQWIKSSADADQLERLMKAAAEEFASTLPRARPVAKPKTSEMDHLMACYPVGDHHTGMLSWYEETGANYDLKIAENLLMGATDYLISKAPKCPKATIVFLGDFVHYDSFTAETPTSRNQLDADSRFPDMIRFAIRGMRYMVQQTLKHHQHVHIVVEIGNHDLSTSICLMECLANVYENEPRVTVDTSPSHYHYFRHGQVLVGIHHGHGAKLPDLPLIMAQDRKEDWGETKYRYWWTGHVHHDQAKDYKGVKVESFRILAPNDAWAAQKGYRAMQDMKLIILDKDFGEVDRSTVNPDMLREKDDALRSSDLS